ncbi:Alpha/Beta hydrolase protein [Jimgerdemannia flammicorona]|uniref:Alpha/Beta hydrolase protein n=1 Tax=Jimgerdemannia flammicorona TaxID=994334 RepID=A0A433QYT6_9FUNG|nr:Alpha/Beta hydrolase protein [Jimgerdemannia flammicorona]
MTLKFLVLKAIAVLVAVQLVNAAPLERRATTGEHSTQTLPAGTPQQHGLATNWTVTGYPSTVAVSRLSSSNNGVAVTSAVVSTLQDFARLASTAYCSVGSAGGQLTCNSYCRNFPNTIVVKTFSISATATIGFIARNDGKKAIYVAYRGSTNINNFIHDSHFFHSKYPPVPGANVHTGFLESFQDARSIVYPTVVEQINNHPGYTLYMVGHSLGGALTVLQALDFYQNAGYTSKNMVFTTTFWLIPKIARRMLTDIMICPDDMKVNPASAILLSPPMSIASSFRSTALSTGTTSSPTCLRSLSGTNTTPASIGSRILRVLLRPHEYLYLLNRQRVLPDYPLNLENPSLDTTHNLDVVYLSRFEMTIDGEAPEK